MGRGREEDIDEEKCMRFDQLALICIKKGRGTADTTDEKNEPGESDCRYNTRIRNAAWARERL